MLADVCGLSEADLSRARHEALDAQLLFVDGATFAFFTTPLLLHYGHVHAPWVIASEIALVFALAAHLTGGLRLLFVEFVGWKSETQKALLAIAGGIAARPTNAPTIRPMPTSSSPTATTLDLQT